MSFKKDEASLLVVAHPDDEWAFINAMNDLSIRAVLIVTHCGNMHEARVAETKKAMALRGIDPSILVFLSPRVKFSHVQAIHHVEEIATEIKSTIDDRNITQVITHEYEGGNPDHDAVYLAALIAARQGGCSMFAFPMYRTNPSGLLLTFRPIRPVSRDRDFLVRYSFQDYLSMLRLAFVYKSEKIPMGILGSYGLLSIFFTSGLTLRMVDLQEELSMPGKGALVYSRYDAPSRVYADLLAKLNSK